MNKKTQWHIAVLAAIVLIAGYTAVFAAHPGGNVQLKQADGSAVSGTTPYSPKATCGGCHNYGSGSKTTVHTQGVIESNNQIYWQSYNVAGFEHGVSVGRHSNQGRNEDYSNTFRSAYALPFFTSSPGMFGKY